jgi:hypothetical protein
MRPEVTAVSMISGRSLRNPLDASGTILERWDDRRGVTCSNATHWDGLGSDPASCYCHRGAQVAGLSNLGMPVTVMGLLFVCERGDGAVWATPGRRDPLDGRLWSRF